MAKWPDLVPKRLCKVPIHVALEQEGYDEDGAPVIALEADLLCNYQDKGQTVINSEQEYVKISGSAYFHGDPFPTITNIVGGWVHIFNEDEPRKIESGEKGRNPDGTVNFTRIRIM